MRNGGMLGDGAMEFVELAEADGRVDVVAQERFACLHAAGQKTIDRLLEKRLAKGGVALEPFPHGHIEISGQCPRLIPQESQEGLPAYIAGKL